LTVDSLAPALARAGHRRLEEYVTNCPGCRKPAAAHIDMNGAASDARPTVVRFVCPDGCVVGDAAVLGLLPVGDRPLSA
jgi:hypothetical protein